MCESNMTSKKFLKTQKKLQSGETTIALNHEYI